MLKTGVSEGKYYFFTQNNGKDTVKSPLGMFDAFSIDNDLAYVDAKIRNYYEFDGAVSDAAIAKMDEEKAGEVEKPEGRRRRTKIIDPDKVAEEVAKVSDAIESAEAVEIVTEERSRRRKTHDEVVAENNEKIAEYVKSDVDASIEAAKELGVDPEDEGVPFDLVDTDVPKLDPVPRRTRKARQ